MPTLRRTAARVPWPHLQGLQQLKHPSWMATAPSLAAASVAATGLHPVTFQEHQSHGVPC